MSQLERLAEAIAGVGKQAGPVQQNIATGQRSGSQLAASVPNDENGYARTIRMQLYEGVAALREAERLLADFDKQADGFAKRLVAGASVAAGSGGGAAPGDSADVEGQPASTTIGEATPSGREFLEATYRNQGLKQKIAAMPVQPGEYTATLHGNAHEVEIDGHVGDAFDLANAIRADPSWNGQPVFLLSCHTGAKPDGIAQQLASLLKVPVRAPTGAASFAGDPPHPVTGTFVQTPIGRIVIPNHRFITFKP